MRSAVTSTTCPVPASNLRRLIVVVRPAVMHVVMPSTNHTVTNYVVPRVMVLDATGRHDPGTTTPTTSRARPLVAAVRIVKQRVLVRLRIRVKVVVDLGLQLVGDGRGRCCGGCRG